MRFTIIATKPGPQPPQSSCDFLPPGGTIGRGADNNLVLPDDDRTISRLQAIVHITADGECRITNRGNVTLVHLNDIPLERGRQVDLQEGDILSIDDYRLQVSELASAARPAQPAPAPIARPAPVAKPAAPQESKPAAIPTEIWDSLAQEFSITDSLSSSRSKPAPTGANPLTETAQDRNPVDPLAQFARQSNALNLDRRDQTPDSLFNDDPLFNQRSIFDDSTPGTLTQQPAQSRSAKADEVDPLALFGGGSTPAQLNSDDPLGLMTGSAVPLTPLDEKPANPPQSAKHDAFVPPTPKALDSDFDDERSAQSASRSQDAFSQSPLFNEQRNDSGNGSLFDGLPEDAFSHSPLFAEQNAADKSPLLDEQNAADKSPLFDEPPAQPSAADHQQVQQDPASSSRFDDASTAPLSSSPLFDDLPDDAPAHQQDYGGITLPTPQAVARNTTPPPKGRLRIDPVSNPAPQQAASSSGGQQLDGELLEALMGGMGLKDLQPTPRFDSESMQELGQMLSMFSQGTVALLSSRSILKRGVKAEMTVILDEANNPFKLLPSGKSVLMQMFGSRMPGFMPPKQSVRDALVDLQAHQLGMIAGIRAIIASMLQSFNPQQLEEEAKQQGVTSRLSLPGSRKAALWEHFTKRYDETAGEIEDDFHTLFGEAFLHAYDMEVNQYKDSQIRSEE